MIVFTHTDFPEPVAPAMSRCGIFARSAMTGFPSRSLPSAIGSAARALRKSAMLDQLAKADDLRRRDSAPRRQPRRVRESARRCGSTARASRARDRSRGSRSAAPSHPARARPRTASPPVRSSGPTSSPSTLNVRSASMSFTPIASSSRSAEIVLCGGRRVEQVGGRQLVARQLGLLRRLDRRRRSSSSAELAALRRSFFLPRDASPPPRSRRLPSHRRPRTTTPGSPRVGIHRLELLRRRLQRQATSTGYLPSSSGASAARTRFLVAWSCDDRRRGGRTPYRRSCAPDSSAASPP